MIRRNKGISLVSLVITIALMIIISSVTIYTSMDRFKINNLNKMINDLQLLEDKVSNYYLKYGTIPVVRTEQNNTPIEAEYDLDDYQKNNDNDVYYYIDLKALGDGISLNYGKKGFEDLKSDDVYIINEKTHNIYYARGIEIKGKYYYSLSDNNTTTSIIIPPSKPEIKVISGTKNEEGKYTTEVKLAIIPGKDNTFGIEKTTYIINENSETDMPNDNILTINEDGIYKIKIKTYNKKGEYSSIQIQIEIETDKISTETGNQIIENIVDTSSNII